MRPIRPPKGGTLCIAMSVGLNPLHRDEDVDALFAAADTALHAAKANGCDRKEVAIA